MKKIVVIEGVEYEERPIKKYSDGSRMVKLVPILKPQKTLVQIAAEACDWSEEQFRRTYRASTCVYEEIERRLQALEGKGE